MSVLNKSEQKSVISIKNAINTQISLLNKFERNRDFLPQLHKILVTIQRSLDEFDSEMFIVASVGMLKAGKSTLVNLFARTDLASPTGYGIDTTLRPALVTQLPENEKPCIEIWLDQSWENSPKNDDNLKKTHFDDIFLYIRGLKKLSEIPDLSCDSYPLNKENLRNALCCSVGNAPKNMLPKEPVLVVVKTPYNKDSLLQNNISILDTPGLDSYESTWTQDGSYSWLWSKSDLLLFLQSSMAPLNQKAADEFKYVIKQGLNIPISLVQNEMEAKHWLPQEQLDKINNDQLDFAKKKFEDTVYNTFSTLRVNLGMAGACLLSDDHSKENFNIDIPSLWQRSNFSSVEDFIQKTLRDNATKIRKKNCLTSVRSQFENAIAEINELSERLNKTKSQYEKQQECNNKAKEELSIQFKRSKAEFVSGVKVNNSSIFDVKYWEDQIKGIKQKLPTGQESFNAEDLNSYIDKFTINIREEIEKELSNLNYDKIKIIEEKTEESLSNYLATKTKAIIDELKKDIARNHEADPMPEIISVFNGFIDEINYNLKLPLLSEKLKVVFNEIPNIKASPVREWGKRLYFFEKSRSKERAIEVLDNPQKELCSKLQDINNIVENDLNLIKQCLNEIQKYFSEQFSYDICEYNKHLKTQQNEIINDTELLQNLRENLKILKMELLKNIC